MDGLRGFLRKGGGSGGSEEDRLEVFVVGTAASVAAAASPVDLFCSAVWDNYCALVSGSILLLRGRGGMTPDWTSEEWNG